MKIKDIKIGMEVYYAEPDFTSGTMRVVRLERDESGLLWAVGDWGYEVPVAYCSPVSNKPIKTEER